MTNITFKVSTDKAKLDLGVIHDFICHRSYWGKGRTLETVKKSIDHSLCFGIYDVDESFMGFARVVTDYTVFAHLMDVFILETYRGLGAGKKLLTHILGHPDLKEIKFWRLDTDDAHSLYERFGFREPAYPDKIMEKRAAPKSNLHLVLNKVDNR